MRGLAEAGSLMQIGEEIKRQNVFELSGTTGYRRGAATFRSSDWAGWTARGSESAGWHHHDGAWEIPLGRSRGTTATSTFAMRSALRIAERTLP